MRTVKDIFSLLRTEDLHSFRIPLTTFFRDAGLNGNTMQSALHHNRDLHPDEAFVLLHGLDRLLGEIQETITLFNQQPLPTIDRVFLPLKRKRGYTINMAALFERSGLRPHFAHVMIQHGDELNERVAEALARELRDLHLTLETIRVPLKAISKEPRRRRSRHASDLADQIKLDTPLEHNERV